MSRTLLTAVALVALIAMVLSVAAPGRAPQPQASFQPVPSTQSGAPSSILQGHQPPVPMVRSRQAVETSAAMRSEAVDHADRQPIDELRGRAAAKAAIEADGYKGVTVLGKSANGSWRALAYRGRSEVRLIVDGAGMVTTE